MVSNNQTILAKWSKQHNNEDVDKWQWRLNDPPNDICEAFDGVAAAADAATADATAARRGGWGGGGSVVVIDRIKGGKKREKICRPHHGRGRWVEGEEDEGGGGGGP